MEKKIRHSYLLRVYILLSLLHSTFVSIIGSEVGTSGGSVGVNQLGAATYTLPIEVPQGVNGLQPNLSITYNSMAGNGVLIESQISFL